MKNFVKVAVAYAEHGFSVLPLYLDKTPIIKYAGKPPLTVDEIKDLWKKHPYALIGIRTTDFFVVDADVDHKEGVNGVESLNKFMQEHKRQLKVKGTDFFVFERTLRQKTAGGGLQFFFKKPLVKDKKGNETRTGVVSVQQNIGWLPGVDIKANNNNYVVVAPSERYVKDKDGKSVPRAYKWIGDEKEMLEAPVYLIKSINQDNMIKMRNQGKPFAIKHTTSRAEKAQNKSILANRVLNIVANGLGDEGVRNDTLARFVGTLFYLGIDPEVAEKLSQIANANSPEPMSEQETEKTFLSILKTDIRNHGTEEEA